MECPDDLVDIIHERDMLKIKLESSTNDTQADKEKLKKLELIVKNRNQQEEFIRSQNELLVNQTNLLHQKIAELEETLDINEAVLESQISLKYEEKLRTMQEFVRDVLEGNQNHDEFQNPIQGITNQINTNPNDHNTDRAPASTDIKGNIIESRIGKSIEN